MDMWPIPQYVTHSSKIEDCRLSETDEIGSIYALKQWGYLLMLWLDQVLKISTDEAYDAQMVTSFFFGF